MSKKSIDKRSLAALRIPQPSLYCEGTEQMTKVAAFHSKLPNDRNVYHNNNKCTEGDNIEKSNRVDGTGGRPLCEHCARLP